MSDAPAVPPHPSGGRARAAVVVAVVVVLGAVGLARVRSGGEPATHPDPAPVEAEPNLGRFVVECDYSHSLPDDPIVHPGMPGHSHRHDFFGNTAVDAHSTAESIAESDTTCTVKQDRAAYWAPALYVDGEPVEPNSSDAYYRAAPGVDPSLVEPFPFGFVAIGGDPAATEAQSADVAGFACGRNKVLSAEPPTCTVRKPLAVHVVFPDCWDGENLDSPDHRSHVARSTAGACPDSHPVHVPQLELVIEYPVWGETGELRLASGSLWTVHADFVNTWDPEKLANEVEGCLHRDVVCGVPSI